MQELPPPTGHEVRHLVARLPHGWLQHAVQRFLKRLQVKSAGCL
jgi:hypothetical protein